MPGGYYGKSHKEIKRIRKFIAEVNQRFGEKFVEIPREEIGRCQYGTTIKDDGSFDDGISWDRIQQIKSAVGFGDYWGLEVFPTDKTLVNVSNIRHIWLFEERPPFAWSGEECVAVRGTQFVPPTLH